MPSIEAIDDMPYDDWARLVLGHPLLTLDGSFVAFVDGEPAALSLLTADPASGRASSMFTGTKRAYRGRGLGRAVKLASIAWAREHGVTQLATRNDESNVPDARDQPASRLRPGDQARRVAQELLRGNGFFASAASTCDVTHTGVAAYRAE